MDKLICRMEIKKEDSRYVVSIKFDNMIEKYRGKGVMFKKYGVELVSVTNPAIYDTQEIYLPGSETHRDGEIAWLPFADKEEALNYAATVYKLIESFNLSLVEDEITEMTMTEVCKALGKNVKIVKEK